MILWSVALILGYSLNSIMHWILLAVVVVGLLYLAWYFPRVGFAVLGGIVVAGVVVVLVTTDLVRGARGRLPVGAIVIEAPRMQLTYANSYRFMADLVNQHPIYTLQEVVVSITMLDCAGEAAAHCQTLDTHAVSFEVWIPPLESRMVAQTATFAATPRDTVRWLFTVSDTRSGREP